MNLQDLGTGAPGIAGEITDYSSFSGGTLRGLNIFIGETERGTPNKPVLLRTESDYYRHFGGMLAHSKFPYMIVRYLRRGGRCYVIPVHHYTDVTDVATIVGTPATKTLTLSSNSAVFNAAYPGTWGNQVKVTVAAAASGTANLRDITVEIIKAGFETVEKSITDFPKTPTVEDKAKFKQMIEFVEIGTVTGEIPVGNVTLENGARDYAAIVNADYIGSPISKTGIYGADVVRDAVRICIPDKASNALDLALAAYVDQRKDMAAMVRTPLGLDDTACIAYRDATGTYTGTAVNSWRTIMWTGGLVTRDDNANEISHSELVDVLVNYSRKDTNKSANFSPSGMQRGIIENAVRPVYDFGLSSRETQYGNIYQKGINAVISDYDESGLGAVVRLAGNKTLWRKKQLLQEANIAEYLIWLYRSIMPKVKYQQFDPNDPIMWKALFNEIKPILERSRSAKMRAIYDYRYIGDQLVENVEDAVFNQLEDLQQGIYKFRILVKPTPAAVWIGFEIGVTNIGVNFNEINL